MNTRWIVLAALFSVSSAFGAEEPAGSALAIPAPAPQVVESSVKASDSFALPASRRFGFGLGAGYTTETGNASLIYGPSRAPSLNARAAYWIDPRLALQLSVENSRHGNGIYFPTDVNLLRALLQAKYYFEAAFRPHLIAGGGMYWRTDTINFVGDGSSPAPSTTQSALGFNFGAGLEIPLAETHACLQLEAIAHSVAFSDDSDPQFIAAGISDRTGIWVVAQAALVLSW